MSNTNSLISIIVPVYNVEPYLRQCLDSIVNQTYSNLEIILIDDGSSDGSPQICDVYASKDNRIVVIHKENGGQSEARNRGLDICKGEFISFIDSDDWVERDYIEILYNELTLHNSDISIINHNHFSLDGTYNSIKAFKNETISNIDALKLLITKEPIQHLLMCGKLYKKELFNEIRFPVGQIFEEHLICYKVYYNSKKITSCNKVLYHYLKRSDSTMGQAVNIDYIPMWSEQADYFIEKKEFKLAYIVYCRIAKLCLWNSFNCKKTNQKEKESLDKAHIYCQKAYEVKKTTNFSYYVLKLFVFHPNLYTLYRKIIDLALVHFQNNL